MKHKTMLLKVKKGKKGNFYKKRIRPVSEDDKYYFFCQEDARSVTMEWLLNK